MLNESQQENKNKVKKRKKEIRDSLLGIRLEPTVRMKLEELALSKGMTASSLGRFFIEEGLKKEIANKKYLEQ